MDTGVGRTSYSIMAQGQIDQILSSKPEERRAVFEDVDPLYAAICLDGMLNAFVCYWSRQEGGEPSAEHSE